MAFYIFYGGNVITPSAWVQVSPTSPTVNRTYAYQTNAINSCAGYYYVHFNIDDTFPHASPQNSVNVYIGLTAGYYFGIR
jgi:hypothetical protein